MKKNTISGGSYNDVRFDRIISKNTKDVDNDSLVMRIDNCKSREELKSDEVKQVNY